MSSYESKWHWEDVSEFKCTKCDDNAISIYTSSLDESINDFDNAECRICGQEGVYHADRGKIIWNESEIFDD